MGESRRSRVPSDMAGRPASRQPSGYSLARVHSAVVVAVCPFDLVAGFGGSLAMLAAARRRIRVVTGWDEPAVTPTVRSVDHPLLGALGRLGASDAEVVFLRMPSGFSVTARTEDLTRRLAVLVQGFDLCAAPWCGDRAADSGALRWAALLACSLRLRPPLIEYFSGAGGDEPWDRAAWVRLSAHSARAKNRALAGWPAADPRGPTAENRGPRGPHASAERELVFR